MTRHICLGATMLCVASALDACSTQQLVSDQPVSLQLDQGVAAVMLNAPARIEQLQFAPRFPGGKSFEVPDTQGGPALFLLPVTAGRYCLEHFRYNGGSIKSKEDLGCFTVVPGQITYSGTITPELGNFNSHDNTTLYTAHHYEPQQFDSLLHAQYPKMAAAYPLAGPPPVPAGVEQPSLDYPLISWVKRNADHTETIYIQNNTAWQHRLDHFQLYDCINIKQACSPQSVDILFAPFEVKQMLVVEPADKQQGYNFRFNYDSRPVD